MARTYFPAVPANTCSINVRLSREATEENLSKDGMIEDCVSLAESMGLKVVNVHVDDGISGAVRNRPGFLAWLDDARSCRVDHLIAWHVDRMTREGVNVAAMILDTIEGKDPETGKQVRRTVRLLDTKGLDSAGDEGAFRFRFVIAAEVARAERERSRDRSKQARRRAATSGRWSGGTVPFGFRVVNNPNGAGKVLEVDEAEASIVREAAERLLAGENLSSVVRWANGPSGLPPRRAARWVRRTLMQVLTGFPVQGRVVHLIDNKPVPVVNADGEPVTIPAILSPDESAAVRALLAPKPDPKRGGRHPARLLSTLLSCHRCGERLQVARRTDKSVTYRCQTAREAGECDQPVSVSATALEDYIERRFLDAWGSSPEYVKRAQVTGAAEVEAAEEAVTAALNALSQVATPEAFQALQEAQKRRAEALALPQETQVLIVPSGRTVAEAWEAGDVHTRRDLLATNYAAIIVGPGRRGGRGFDASRLSIVAQPPHVLGAQDGFRRGSMVV